LKSLESISLFVGIKSSISKFFFGRGGGSGALAINKGGSIAEFDIDTLFIFRKG
jgi:hypothetical protein